MDPFCLLVFPELDPIDCKSFFCLLCIKRLRLETDIRNQFLFLPSCDSSASLLSVSAARKRGVHHKTQNHCKCPDLEILGHFLFHTSLNNEWKWPAGANTEAGPGGGGGHEE